MKDEPHPQGVNPAFSSRPARAEPPSEVAGKLVRRDFLRLLGLGGAALTAFRPWEVAMAGPFTRSDFQHLVPADKKLSPAWVDSLFARGVSTTYTKSRDELRYLGMPVGGLCAGQLYLGGDGKLWHWDVFNQKISTGADHYAQPLKPSSPLEQGFALRLATGANIQERALDGAHWKEITFTGEYPLGRVRYADPDCPVGLEMQAFSPFIPLNTDDSSLPATIIEFHLTNNGAATVEGELGGWLENAVCLYSAQPRKGLRRNRIVREPAMIRLECTAEVPAPDAAREQPEIAPTEADFGSLALALLNPQADDAAQSSLPAEAIPAALFSASAANPESITKPFGEKLIGSLARKFRLAPKETVKATFVLTWFFPNLKLDRLPAGRFYATRFSSAPAVTAYVVGNFERLAAQTRLWHDTWYDSTLPYWFLDRTFLNTSILATATCYRLGNGRFYSWEGVGCCEGTCGHVWHYAHAVARIFPELERLVREQVDFGLALQPDGAIHFRGEFNQIPAVDGQAGVILRALREHEMSADDAFLKRNWPAIRKATEWLIDKDANGDGLIESNQHNTLDTDWYGKVAWLSGLYLAALEAAGALAVEAGDEPFAARCRTILDTGRKNFVAQLFEEDYFVNRVDPKHLEAINSGTGCEIDQVMGQSWAFQVGLPRVLPETETRAALKSLWRYNFTPDVGPYRKTYTAGRWYALPGEAGLLMCTFPRTDWDYAQAKGKGPEWAAGYFDECMNGFEYQVAGHMLWEGLILEGLAVTRAVHDRYHAARRNPWNEVECGDHYVRSMASYGVFLAACGFEYHGPKGRLGFAPRLTPEKFQAAFVGAEGWGTYRQQRSQASQTHQIVIQYGQLQIQTLAVELPPLARFKTVAARCGSRPFSAQAAQTGARVEVNFPGRVTVKPGDPLEIILAWEV